MTKDEVLKMAIETIKSCKHLEDTDKVILSIGDYKKLVDAFKEALDTEQVREDLPAQEPYAWATEWEDDEWSISHSPNMGKQSIPLYTKEQL